MRERGVEPVAVELDENEPLPDWREFDAVLAMGGPMGADDDAEHPWLSAEKAAGARGRRGGPPLPRRLPRRAAAGLRARRARSARSSSPEVGLLPVELTAEGREHPLFEGLDDPFASLQWHGDTFDLPAGAVRLASSPLSPTRPSRPASAPTGSSSTSRSRPRWPASGPRFPHTAPPSPRRSARSGATPSSPSVERRAEELHPPARRLFGNWLTLAGDAA